MQSSYKKEPVLPVIGIGYKTLLNSIADLDRMLLFLLWGYIAYLMSAQGKYEVIFEEMH